MSTLRLMSSVFEHNGSIPAKYTCDGDNKLSPPLQIFGAPEAAKSLVLLMDDPDIPEVKKQQHGLEAFDHWVLFNIPPGLAEIAEGDSHGTMGAHSGGEIGYVGPCPPPEYEPKEHRYIFRLYALDTILTLEEGASRKEVVEAMEGHVLDTTELIGRYARNS